MKHLHGQVMHRKRKPRIFCVAVFPIRNSASLHFHCPAHGWRIPTGTSWYPWFQNTLRDWQNFRPLPTARKIMNFYCFLIIRRNPSRRSISGSLMNILCFLIIRSNPSRRSISGSLMNILNSGTTARCFGVSAVPVSVCLNLFLPTKRHWLLFHFHWRTAMTILPSIPTKCLFRQKIHTAVSIRRLRQIYW